MAKECVSICQKKKINDITKQTFHIALRNVENFTTDKMTETVYQDYIDTNRKQRSKTWHREHEKLLQQYQFRYRFYFEFSENKKTFEAELFSFLLTHEQS